MSELAVAANSAIWSQLGKLVESTIMDRSAYLAYVRMKCRNWQWQVILQFGGNLGKLVESTIMDRYAH
jgi:hypothetical protein